MYSDMAARILKMFLFGTIVALILGQSAVGQGKKRAENQEKKAPPSQMEWSNTAEGLTPVDLDHVFEPFWRKEGARSDREHLGMGLPIAQSFAQSLRASLEARLPARDVFRVSLNIPRVRAC